MTLTHLPGQEGYLPQSLRQRGATGDTPRHTVNRWGKRCRMLSPGTVDQAQDLAPVLGEIQSRGAGAAEPTFSETFLDPDLLEASSEASWSGSAGGSQRPAELRPNCMVPAQNLHRTCTELQLLIRSRYVICLFLLVRLHSTGDRRWLLENLRPVLRLKCLRVDHEDSKAVFSSVIGSIASWDEYWHFAFYTWFDDMYYVKADFWH